MKEERICPHCESPLGKEKKPYILHGIVLGRFEVLVCTVCRRVYHPETTAKAIEEAAKEKGMWGLEAEEEIPEVELVPITGEEVSSTNPLKDWLLVIGKRADSRAVRPSGRSRMIRPSPTSADNNEVAQ